MVSSFRRQPSLVFFTEPSIRQHNMLSVRTSNSHWILSLKLLLLSSAILSTAAVLIFSVPVVADILVSDVPGVWSSIVFWLRPPYLYLLVNFIIITILASSKLHQDLVDPPPTVPLAVSVPKILSADSPADYTVLRAVGDVLDKTARDANENFAADVLDNDVKSDAESEYSRVSDRENDEENGEIKNRNGLQREDSMAILIQKYEKKPPIISSKVGTRKAAKPTIIPAGTTLDDAWKAITEGRSAPFSERLHKSDTWESHTRRDETAIDRNNTPPKVKKSETTPFDEGSGGKNQELRQSAAPVRLRKKPSLTGEELNRRVEAFIEKFKEEMRLQREESLKKFQEMINQRDYY